ncbi:hypothetical protein IFM89_027280 [Coptis chinensis]|uniref:Uncharacterized protein n=1 Tax=Coptis chinensis TaxID=261450 RepID=A0A835LNT5_9MAGN|nr:hypothetical protein IFM89_027280 [Coptis chinensis]
MKVSNLAVFSELFSVLSVANVSMAQICNPLLFEPLLGSYYVPAVTHPQVCCTRLRSQRILACAIMSILPTLDYFLADVVYLIPIARLDKGGAHPWHRFILQHILD